MAGFSYVRERYSDVKRDLARLAQMDNRTLPRALFLESFDGCDPSRWWRGAGTDALQLAERMEALGDTAALCPRKPRALAAVWIEALLSRATLPAMPRMRTRLLRSQATAGLRLSPWNVPFEVTQAGVTQHTVAHLQIEDSAESFLRNALDAVLERARRNPVRRGSRLPAKLNWPVAPPVTKLSARERHCAVGVYRKLRRSRIREGTLAISTSPFASSPIREALPGGSSYSGVSGRCEPEAPRVPTAI